MKIKLTDNDGLVLEEWEIERDFGDIRKRIFADTMTSDIISAYKHYKTIKEDKN